MLHFSCFIPNGRLRLGSYVFHKVNWIGNFVFLLPVKGMYKSKFHIQSLDLWVILSFYNITSAFNPGSLNRTVLFFVRFCLACCLLTSAAMDLKGTFIFNLHKLWILNVVDLFRQLTLKHSITNSTCTGNRCLTCLFFWKRESSSIKVMRECLHCYPSVLTFLLTCISIF